MKTEIIKEDKTSLQNNEKKPRKIVVPGEVIVEGQNYLPGENARREGKEIISMRYGLLDINDRLVKVIPLSGVYLPRKGNVIIGKVIDISYNGWLIDINSPYSAFLPIMECRGFITKRDDLSQIYDYDEMIIAKVIGVKGRGVDLSTKERGFHKIDEGIIIKINPHKVPRIIGRQGSMVNMIKDYTKCNIVVGQNGLIWVKGDSIESELIAKDVINFIADQCYIDGLTDKVKEYLEEKTKEEKTK